MISSPSDYRYIAPVGQIDGGILPARDVAANGSAHDLRAEDLCFAIEAVDERRSAFGLQPMSGGTAPVPSLVLSRMDWHNLATHLNELIGANSFYPSFAVYPPADAAHPAADWPAKPYSTSSRPGTLAALYPDMVVSERAADSTHPVLDHGYVRMFYRALKVSDSFCMGADAASWSGSQTYQDRYGDSTTTALSGSVWGSGNNHLVQALRYHDADYDGVYELTLERITAATLACTLPRPDLIQSAVLVVCFNISADDGRQWGNHWFTRSFVVGADVASTGVVSIPESVLKMSDFDLAAEVGSLGYSFPATATGIARLNVAALECVGAWLVVNYDFRTEIRSLGWSWAP